MFCFFFIKDEPAGGKESQPAVKQAAPVAIDKSDKTEQIISINQSRDISQADKTLKTVVFETEPNYQILANPARVLKQQVFLKH